jgi:protein Tex
LREFYLIADLHSYTFVLMNRTELIAKQIGIQQWQAQNAIGLLDDGATIPFISRYRKEATGGLDEVQIGEIKKEVSRLIELDKRREAILKSIKAQDKLTDELSERIGAAIDLNALEDMYLPFKKKRKTKASVARENGLEPLAKILMAQKENEVEGRARKFITNKVTSVEDALAGARSIVAEWICENAAMRKTLRRFFEREAVVVSKPIKGKEEEGEKFKDYFNYSESLSKCRSHRMLALRRGEHLGFLKLSLLPPEAGAIEKMERFFVKGGTKSSLQIKKAIKDAYKRLLRPSLENEVRNRSKEKADKEAINVFVKNLRQLLLAAPLGQKRIMAVDPGFRSGCKLVCLDEKGDLLYNENVYPHAPQNQKGKAMSKISNLVETYNVDAIAIGNGTASRETEAMVKRIKFSRNLQVFIVSEDGASVYSASKVAREEFPQYDVTVRGAVSIGRRLMDPLSELVKIDPKSIGVGQYQHDVDEKMLKESLDTVVESCVNSVGVDLNTASKYLLNYVSGIGLSLAECIVKHREEEGPYKSRAELLGVSRMGSKAYEQCAGFMRVSGGDNPLDNSAVHPERYELVEQLSKDLDLSIQDLIGNDRALDALDLSDYVCDDVGLTTMQDIVDELKKPGRDPRKKARIFEFEKGIHKIQDLKAGMRLPGIVTNITNFGCFVDVGVKQDGLLHISNMADRFISDPNEVVTLHEHVEVEVLEIDVKRSRIGFRLLSE